MEVKVESYQDPDAPKGEVTIYDAIPGRLRDVGRQRRQRGEIGQDLEAALTALRVGRRGDPRHYRFSGLSY